MARDIDPFKVSSPRIFLVRMLVFLILCSLIVVVIHPQIFVAFKANPPLNTLIIGVLLIGIILAFRQVIRLFREVAWVNGFRLADPGIAVERPPVLLAPMAAILGDRIGRMSMSSQTMRDHPRLDRHPARRGARNFPLHDRAADLPRPARHVLGPDRNRQLGRRRDQQSEGRRRRQRGVRVRCARGWPRRSAAWASRSRRRCSDWPARWCWASSICR